MLGLNLGLVGCRVSVDRALASLSSIYETYGNLGNGPVEVCEPRMIMCEPRIYKAEASRRIGGWKGPDVLSMAM